MTVVGLKPLDRLDLAVALEDAALPRLRELLLKRDRGHCMRVTDIDDVLAARLCARLRAEVPNAEVVILSGDRTILPAQLTVSSTKLVELRNPFPDGTQRPPLLVFIPNDVRAAAEDSFSRATFEEVSIADVYGTLRDEFIRDLPAAIRDAVGGVIRCLTTGDNTWQFADEESVVRFLLTARLNNNDPESFGAALYELALVPDFELLTDPASTVVRLRRNQECVQTLTWSDKSERGRVLELGLNDANLRQRLGNFLASAGLEDPRSWTRQVVADRANWDLAFNTWTFDDGGYVRDTICISAVNAQLQILAPSNTADGLTELAGQRVLPVGPGGARKFTVSFQVDPLPSRLVGLASFVLQVVSQESGSVSLVRNKSAWRGPNASARVTFNRIDKLDWEEGWYFVRVLARSDTGEMFPLADVNGEPVQPGAWDPGTAPNESDLFYVLPGSDVEVEPPQRALQREASMVHARTRLRFAALLAGDAGRDPTEVSLAAIRWAERSPRARTIGSEMLELDFGRDGRMSVPVSRVLRFLEQSILNSADGPQSWRVPISADGAEEPVAEHGPWPSSDSAANFLAARRA